MFTAPTPKPNWPCTKFGGSGYLTRAISASLQTLGAAGSFLCRVKLIRVDATQYIVASPTTDANLRIYILANAKLYAGAAGANANPNLAIVPGAWYDVLVTWAYPGNVVAYVCPAGGSDTTATVASAAAGPWTSAVVMGAATTSSVSPLNGSMRDVMLLSRVITPEEWTAYKAGVKPTGSVVADWPLYPDWNDDSGNANNLSSGGIAPTYKPKAAPTPKAVP